MVCGTFLERNFRSSNGYLLVFCLFFFGGGGLNPCQDGLGHLWTVKTLIWKFGWIGPKKVPQRVRRRVNVSIRMGLPLRHWEWWNESRRFGWRQFKPATLLREQRFVCFFVVCLFIFVQASNIAQIGLFSSERSSYGNDVLLLVRSVKLCQFFSSSNFEHFQHGWVKMAKVAVSNIFCWRADNKAGEKEGYLWNEKLISE